MRRHHRFTNLHKGLAAWATLIVLVLASFGATESQPRRVLLLYSYERDFAPHSAFSRLFRQELSSTSSEPVDFIEVSLQAARVSRTAPTDSMVGHVHSMLGGRQPDLVVPIGGPAAVFAQENHGQLFPEAPMLLAGVDQRFVHGGAIGANDTVVAVDHEPARMVENILRVLPDTTTIFVVVGASHLEQAWLRDLKKAFRPFEDRVTFSWANELSFAEMVSRCAGLPARSAILFAILSLDAAGVPHVEERALSELRTATSAPIFGVRSTQLGQGIVGGPLLSVESLSRNTADAARRLLNGEPAGRISTPTQLLAAPVFDWRELQRWQIDEARLPLGSAIRFREATAWEKYQRPIVVFMTVAGVQALLVVALVANLTRQRRARSALSNLSRRLMQTYEHERTQVARELKDDLCQRMTMLTMRLHEFSQAPGGGDQGEIRKGVEELKQQVASLAGDTFAISDQLHSSKLDLGLVSATRMHCNELSAHHGVAIDVRDQDVPSDLPEEVALALFRVMQEALHNTMKHAAAHSVIVSLRGAPNEMQLAVADDGIGFDPDAVMTDRALGLIGMRERLNLVDGECAIESRPGAGTRMCARVPLRQNLH